MSSRGQEGAEGSAVGHRPRPQEGPSISTADVSGDIYWESIQNLKHLLSSAAVDDDGDGDGGGDLVRGTQNRSGRTQLLQLLLSQLHWNPVT